MVVIVRFATARARNLCHMRSARTQQAGQHGCTRLMHAGASSHLDRFQVQRILFSAAGKDYLEERLDFA
jgi:hypothetical protein